MILFEYIKIYNVLKLINYQSIMGACSSTKSQDFNSKAQKLEVMIKQFKTYKSEITDKMGLDPEKVGNAMNKLQGMKKDINVGIDELTKLLDKEKQTDSKEETSRKENKLDEIKAEFENAKDASEDDAVKRLDNDKKQE